MEIKVTEIEYNDELYIENLKENEFDEPGEFDGIGVDFGGTD